MRLGHLSAIDERWPVDFKLIFFGKRGGIIIVFKDNLGKSLLQCITRCNELQCSDSLTKRLCVGSP